MFPLLHKIIETKPSNNLTYKGGIGRFNTVESNKDLSNSKKNILNIRRNSYESIMD